MDYQKFIANKPYYTDGKRTIWLGDCREILPTLPKCDLVLTDPPYGITLNTDNSRLRNRRAKA